MDFLKTLMAYMAATLMVAVESTSTPSVTPEPTPGPEPVRIVATAEPTEEPTATPEPTVSVTPVPVPTITPNTRAYHNIASGAKGAEVRRIQERLIELGYLPEGSADGVYGRQTANAVRRFQYYNGLTQDGIAGRTTQTNLFENPDAARYPQETATVTPEGTPAPQLTTEPPAAEETPEAEDAEGDQEKTGTDAVRGGTYEQRAAQRKAEEAAAAAAQLTETAEDVTPIPAGTPAESPAQAETPAEAAQETPAITSAVTPEASLAETPGEISGETSAETAAEASTETPSAMPAENSAEAEPLTEASEEAAAASSAEEAEETSAEAPGEGASETSPEPRQTAEEIPATNPEDTEEQPAPATEEPAAAMPGEAAAATGTPGAETTPEAMDEVVEHVDLDAIEETAAPQPDTEPERLEYEDLAGWVVLNGSGEALQWTEMSEGVPVTRSPRMQRNGDDIRISLDDTVRSLEGWELTDEGDSIVLVAEGYTLALLNEHAGFAAAVDGAEMAVDVNDFDFGEGHFIRASFLTEALDGEWKWDGEEETLTLEIPGKDQNGNTD